MHIAQYMAASYYHNKGAILDGLSERYPMIAPKEWALKIVPEEEYDKLVQLSKS
jgi:hypothetical protein